jgi:type I restriction-modification system, S subunit
MDTKALRQKILDLAIRGKLVPQDPNDEPAEVLLERIREQKQQMFKEGKLKKKDIKNDTIIFKGEDNLHYEKFQDGTVKCIEDEIPFEVPEGWSWCRLRDLLNVCSSKRVLQSDWKNEGIPFYRAREIVKLSENDFVENDLFISKENYLELEKNYGIPQSGDLMVSGVGTIGKVYIVKPEDQFYYNSYLEEICLHQNITIKMMEFHILQVQAILKMVILA